jgi:hypothetical protein
MHIVFLTRNVPLSEKQYQGLLQKRQEVAHPSIENKHKLPLPKLGRQVIGEMILKEATSESFKNIQPRFVAIDIPSMTYLPLMSWSVSKEDYDKGAHKGSVFLMEGVTCQETKQPRGAAKFCLRLDNLMPKPDAVEKYKASYPNQRWDVSKLVIGFETNEQRLKWMAAFNWAMDAKNINIRHRQALIEERLARNHIGLGLAIAVADDGNYKIRDWVQNSPVHLCRKILPGDIVVRVNQTVINGIGFEEFEDLANGPLGSTVTLTLRRQVQASQVLEFTVDLTRAKYRPPPLNLIPLFALIKAASTGTAPSSWPPPLRTRRWTIRTVCRCLCRVPPWFKASTCTLKR